MTTPDNRALWELVEKWREDGMDMIHKPSVLVRIECREHANELAAILERPVAVGDVETELVRLFTSGYLRGHHDTVEGNYTDVYYGDRTTYFSDDVKEILTDSDYSTLESMVRWKS